MAREHVIAVGTRKGAFVFSSKDGRRTWKATGPYFRGHEVYHVVFDSRNGALFASANSNHWGPTVWRSDDMGATWKEAKKPPKFPKGSKLSVSRVWHIEPGAEDEPEKVFAGVEPACLFASSDGGDTWKVNESMLSQPTRPKWQAGGGGLCLHTILLDPTDERSMHVAISSVGTLFSADGGESWEFRNKNVLADYSPVKYPEYGQCVHKLSRSPKKGVIYHQNHCGVYRSDDDGRDWKDVRNNLPSRFGFPVAADPNDWRKAYLAPLEGDFSRIAPEGRFAVWGTDNAGKDWTRLSAGIPDVSYYTVLREGLVADREEPTGLYFGTTTGQLFASRNGGEKWERVADGLPPILSVHSAAR